MSMGSKLVIKIITISKIKFLFFAFLIHSVSSVEASTSSAVLEAINRGVKDVVMIDFNKFFGSGFVVRDQVTGKPILFTAYHVVKGFKPDLSEISVFTIRDKQLKIKRLLSYSKKLDLVLFELETYEGLGLKLAKHPIYDKASVYVLGYSGYKTTQQEQVRGTSFHLPTHKTLTFITGSGGYVSGGMSGSPVLNSDGEVIGIYSKFNRIYEYSMALKVFYLDKFMSEPVPPTKWFTSHSIPPLLYLRSNPFFSKTVFSQLQQLVDSGSVDAQNMLVRLHKGILLEAGIGVLTGSMALMILFNTVNSDFNIHSFLNFTSFALSSAFSVNQCSKVFRYVRSKISIRQ